MIIIPAIDIRQGKCVMLKQGKLEHEKIYSNDPVFIAKLWNAKGANRLHIIDLDGAFCGVPQNIEILKNILNSVNCIIQFGGGIRNIKTIEQLIKIGVHKIILGTIVIYNPELFKEIIKKYRDKIIVALDVKNNKVAIAGWKEIVDIDPSEMIHKMELLNVKEVILTDVEKDGTLEGINLENIKQIMSCSKNIKFIVSGGITNLEDINRMKELEKYGLECIIIGKTLYEEKIKFEEIIKIA